MDVREKLVELSDIQVLQREIECVKRKSYTNCTDCLNCDLLMKDERILSAYANAIDALKNANGVTVRECKVVEIGQFKLPIADAILILKEEHKQRADGYATHLSYGGKGDPAEEVYLDALEMAIAALELQKQIFPHYRKEND